MKTAKLWRSVLGFIVVVIFSLLEIKASAAIKTPQTSINNEETTLAQDCPYKNPRLRYGRVATKDGDDLYIRSSPRGKIIGAVPFGWAVVTVKRDATEQWIYIDEQYPYGSAPALTRGWVSAKFIKPLGRFCEKPTAFIRTTMNGLFASSQVLVNEDWIQRSDRLASLLKGDRRSI